MKQDIAIKLAPLASATFQQKYMVNGTVAEYLIPEDILNDAYDCVRLARDFPEERTGLTPFERSALLELEPFLDAIQSNEPTTNEELIRSPVWQQARVKTLGTIGVLGFNLNELEKRI